MFINETSNLKSKCVKKVPMKSFLSFYFNRLTS